MKMRLILLLMTGLLITGCGDAPEQTWEAQQLCSRIAEIWPDYRVRLDIEKSIDIDNGEVGDTEWDYDVWVHEGYSTRHHLSHDTSEGLLAELDKLAPKRPIIHEGRLSIDGVIYEVKRVEDEALGATYITVTTDDLLINPQPTSYTINGGESSDLAAQAMYKVLKEHYKELEDYGVVVTFPCPTQIEISPE